VTFDLAFLSDPRWVEFGFAAWVFVALVCGVGPLSALRSRRVMAGATLPVSRLRIYATTFLWLAALTWLGWLTARQSGVWLFLPARLGVREIAIGAIGLAAGFAVRPLLDRFLSAGRKRQRLLAPRTGPEKAGFVGLVAAAAFGEEVIYRGVLFMLFAGLTHSWWIAALGASVVFGLAHLAYGWRTALVVMVYGLRDHLVVGLTGGLYVAMGVHFLHDMFVGAIASRAAWRDEIAAGAGDAVAG
jgi:membrane protease YdiL (CAAX protease family)